MGACYRRLSPVCERQRLRMMDSNHRPTDYESVALPTAPIRLSITDGRELAPDVRLRHGSRCYARRGHGCYG
jgi:hypothetical protein